MWTSKLIYLNYSQNFVQQNRNTKNQQKTVEKFVVVYAQNKDFSYVSTFEIFKF